MRLKTANKHRRRSAFLKPYRARGLWVNTGFFFYRNGRWSGPMKRSTPKGSNHES